MEVLEYADESYSGHPLPTPCKLLIRRSRGTQNPPVLSTLGFNSPSRHQVLPAHHHMVCREM